jgi:hypothetical protein
MSVPQQPASPPQGASTEPALQLPSVGQLWQRTYQIDAVRPPPDGALHAWTAHRTDTDEPLEIVAYHDSAPPRAQIWESLRTQQLASLQQAQAAHTCQGMRIEIYAAPPPVSLRTWRRAQSQITPTQLHTLVRAIAEAIHRLHQLGIVHLNISPDTIHLTDHNGDIHPVLAGLTRTTLFQQDQLIPIEPSPFYAPPEAAGLTRHQPGHPLCAWDWWSLGRVVQECLLGKHIIGVMLNRDVDFARPEFRSAAENLLLEQDRSICRAGGLELMPVQTDQTQSLLRGLLASARDGRWCYDDIAAWLRGETVRDHYQTRRRERLFRYRNRAYTAAEAADALRTAANWPHLTEHVYEPQKPDTLANFIHDTPGLQEIQQRWSATLALANDESLQQFPQPLVREVVASLALLELAGNRFIWRGHTFDATWLNEWLGREDFDLALLTLLAAPVITCKIKLLDTPAGLLLEKTHHLANEALALCRAGHWIHPTEEASAIPKLWKLALQPVTALQQNRATLHERFALSTQPAMEQIFHNNHPSLPELIVLAWIERHLERAGFVTHELWAQQQYEQLSNQGRRLATFLFWMRLEKALRAGPCLFANPRWMLPCWAILTLALSLTHPGPFGLAVATVPLIAILVLRLATSALIRKQASLYSPQSTPWRWYHTTARCAAEHAELADKNLRTALNELHQINTKIDLIPHLAPPPAPVSTPPRMVNLWAAALASWGLLAAVIAFTGWRLHIHLPTFDEIKLAWSPPETQPEDPKRTSIGQAPIDEPARDVKVSWPFRAPLSLPAPELQSVQPATTEQMAEALRAGLRRVAQYKPETITTRIAIPIETTSGSALILFDGAQGKLIGKNTYSLSYRPAHRSWILLDNQPALVLAE